MNIATSASIEERLCCPLCKGGLTAEHTGLPRPCAEMTAGDTGMTAGDTRMASGDTGMTAGDTRMASNGTEMNSGDTGYSCGSCRRAYPRVAGILDFRICEDPYIDIEADRAKALRIEERASKLSFEDLVAFYYSITPEVPDDLGRHYLNHHVAGVARGEGIINRIKAYRLSKQAEPGVDVLDVGCGTGGLLAAARRKGANCFGADIALRWLVIARSRFRDLGLGSGVDVVCACADHLPFREDSFDLILAENLIEHCPDPTAVLAEVKRVKRPGGGFLARTINRFALGPEPHVGVVGVGYLPRQMMDGYVRLVKGIPYEHIHLQSFGSLTDSLHEVGDESLSTRVPVVSRADYAHHPGWKKLLFNIYAASLSAPLLGTLFARVGPYIDVVSNPSVPDAVRSKSK